MIYLSQLDRGENILESTVATDTSTSTLASLYLTSDQRTTRASSLIPNSIQDTYFTIETLYYYLVSDWPINN